MVVWFFVLDHNISVPEKPYRGNYSLNLFSSKINKIQHDKIAIKKPDPCYL